MKILAISGSLQAKSSNEQLLEAVEELAPKGVEVAIFGGLRDLPHYDPDLERSGVLPAVEDWRRQLKESDAVLIACPEYGHSLPGSLKNAIDWVIGSGELEKKIVGITASVPHRDRGRLGLAALKQTLGAVSATIVGGEPIARGETFEREITALLTGITNAVKAAKTAE